MVIASNLQESPVVAMITSILMMQPALVLDWIGDVQLQY